MGIRGKRVDWSDYFSLNNIELEILLNCVDTMVSELRACELKDLVRPVVFRSINPNLVDKLVSRGVLKKFHKHGRELYALTSRGLKAFIEVAKPVLEVINNEPGLRIDEVSVKVKDKVFYGGIHRVYQSHVRLVERILGILANIGFIDVVDDKFYPRPPDKVVDALTTLISSISSISPIRRIEELIENLVSTLGLDNSVVDDLIVRISAQGINVGEKDPVHALLDLYFKAMKYSSEYSRNGKVVESLAYEALGLEILRALERIHGENKYTRRYWAENYFRFYEMLGDYFYQNLNFEAAKQFYHWAVSVARKIPDLAREAHRANAKYLLSLARSLAHRGRYNEAIARLDELIGYYRSTGLMREAAIAEALRYEYMAEIEVRRNKPCNAYKSWLEASTRYSSLGGEYRSKAEALRVKALISRAECLLYYEKKTGEAIKLLEEASKLAEEILSPHLRNVARSILHEARATLLVASNDFLNASREYGESARFYELRKHFHRALLNTARSYKFKGFHETLNNNLDKATEYFGEAYRKYFELLRNLAKQYSRGMSIDYYMVKEAIKGYFDSSALFKLGEVHRIMKESSIPNEYTLNKIIELMREAAEAWIEAGRNDEYLILEKIIETVKSILDTQNVNSLIRILGDIAELNDHLSEMLGGEISPRKRIFIYISQRILSMIKSSLEIIARYVEELGRM